MAKKTTKPTGDNAKPTKVKRVRKVETVRERNAKATAKAGKTGFFANLRSKIGNFFRKVFHIGRKEVYLPLPDNKAGRFLNKRRSFVPRYFIDSWKELKLVTWPNRKTTWQLTFAVFMFAFIFGALITVVDYGLDKVFRAVLVK
ncbi:preprotein translocase subunit SecE [Candidatus Saccharibacteria bacterium]|nr:preprotein translocase subunit SecE [Candidatus Saccharibacteria bacterium]